MPEPVRLTTDGDFKQHLAWSPNGKRLLFTRLRKGKMGLWTVTADGRELKPLLGAEAASHFDGCWSPDNKKVLFVYDVFHGTDGRLQINSVYADGTGNQVLIPNRAFEESPRLSPDGNQLLFVSSRDGNQEIYRATVDGHHVTRLTRETTANYTPAWSPDGRQIAFTSARFGNLEVCVMNADGGNVRRLTRNSAMDYWPVWSPDGKRIAFTTNRDGNYEIYVMNADGSGQRNLTRNAAQDNYAAWSPDGKYLAFVSNRTGGFDVYSLRVANP
jgi:TolB protein